MHSYRTRRGADALPSAGLTYVVASRICEDTGVKSVAWRISRVTRSMPFWARCRTEVPGVRVPLALRADVGERVDAEQHDRQHRQHSQ